MSMGSLLKAALIGARTVVEKSVGVVSLVLSSTKGYWAFYPSPAMTVLKDLIKDDFKKEKLSIETGEEELENKDKEVEKL